MKKIVLLLLLSSAKISAQLPDTDIWLLDINGAKSSILPAAPVNITARTGYDNQPAFSPDSHYLLYTSIRDGRQSDIYKYDLGTNTISQVTNTPATSEYSPTFMPDGSSISVVMVEADSAQRLWKFPVDDPAKASLVLPNIGKVGYHCWINDTTVGLFLITLPFQLVIADIKNDRQISIEKDTIGRSMHFVKTRYGSKFFYLYHDDFFSLDPAKSYAKTRETFKTFKGEDFCFINPYSIVMADGAKLYKNNYWLDGKDGKFQWTEIADLSKYGIINITRLAVSPDGKHLAFVAQSK